MTITLKNVPRSLHLALKRQAKANKRSLNKEAISCLEAKIVVPPRDKKELLEDIVKFREGLAARGAKPLLDPVKIIRNLRDGR